MDKHVEDNPLARADEHAVRPVIRHIAREYDTAAGLGMDILMGIGGGTEVMFRRVSPEIRRHAEQAVYNALSKALRAADGTRRLTGPVHPLIERSMPAISGALGGVVGFAGVMVEMPIAVSLILRAVLEEAEELGFSSDDEETHKEAMRVFALSGPMSEDDGADLALFITKASITGHTLNALLHKAAPALAAVLGSKVVAQSVPILGAISGATINTVFANYYRQIARVRFMILREAWGRNVPADELAMEVVEEITRMRKKRQAVAA